MRAWQGLVIHHSGGPPGQTVKEIREYHVRVKGWRDIGYHYMLVRGEEGGRHLKVGRSDRLSGAHAGSVDVNASHLGLCVVGCFHPGEEFSERVGSVLYGQILAAVVHLMEKYRLPVGGLVGHCEVRETSCPGDWFPLARLKVDVRARLAGR